MANQSTLFVVSGHLLDCEDERNIRNKITYSDDMAMRYEGIIRKCYDFCERYQHGGDTDIYRHLQTLHCNALESQDEKDWKEYNKKAKEVISNLQKALKKVGKNDLASLLDISDDGIIDLVILDSTLNEISSKILENPQ